jgi:hypothetical protein
MSASDPKQTFPLPYGSRSTSRNVVCTSSHGANEIVGPQGCGGFVDHCW